MSKVPARYRPPRSSTPPPGLHRTRADHRTRRGQPPQAAFYLDPDFEPWRVHLRTRHQVTTGPGLARLLLDRYGAATLPASAIGEHRGALRLRLATGLLYGDSEQQRAAALTTPDLLTLPWIAAALTRRQDHLADTGVASGSG